MVLLQKRDEGGLLSGLWECPTCCLREDQPTSEAAAQLLALARQAASIAAVADCEGIAPSLRPHLKVLSASDIRPVAKPFLHMFSHIHRSVQVFSARVDLRLAKATASPKVCPADAKAQVLSISRLAAAGIPTLTRKVLCSAAAALGFVL
jgi:adenine-specific DNA glycosylase